MKMTFNGCSLTKGTGFDKEHLDPACFANIVARHFLADYVNLAQGGASNDMIFKTSLNCLLNTDTDILVTQWAALNRHWLHPAPECDIYLGSHQFGEFSTTGRDLYVSESQLKKFNEMFLVLNHNYHNIIDLISYCNTLEQVAKLTHKQVFFVNGNVPWQQDLFTACPDTNLELHLSKFTKTLIDFDNRDDNEISRLVNILIDNCQSLNSKIWANRTNSFQTIKVDLNNDGMHPGSASNKLLAEMIINTIENNQ
jgi:hypothetical protein